MNNPVITVVTICYNSESEIEETMRSVLNQSYEQIEYIIIDGASSDKTLGIINKVCLDYPNRKIVVKSAPDHGPYDAMNKGIDLATGRWINFMNAGDSFADDKVIKEFFALADLSGKYSLLYGDVIYKYPFGKFYRDCKPATPTDLQFNHQAMFASVSLMKGKHFVLSYKILADFNFVWKARKEGFQFLYVPRVVACFKHYDGLSTSALNWHKLEMEKYRIEGKPKDMAYYKHVIKDFLQSKLHIHKFWINSDELMIKEVEANPRLTRIAE